VSSDVRQADSNRTRPRKPRRPAVKAGLTGREGGRDPTGSTCAFPHDHDDGRRERKLAMGIGFVYGKQPKRKVGRANRAQSVSPSEHADAGQCC
jgi:hypothetical protein